MAESDWDYSLKEDVPQQSNRPILTFGFIDLDFHVKSRFHCTQTGKRSRVYNFCFEIYVFNCNVHLGQRRTSQ